MTNFKEREVIQNIAISGIIVLLISLYFYWVKFDGQITGFFRIGSVLPLSPYLNINNVLIYSDELGYDGQQFLSLALDPFLHHSGTIQSLDHPAYRYRRILYPLLSYGLGLGKIWLIPYVMVALNALSIVGIVGVISLYFKPTSIDSKSALFILCIPGVWMVLSLSTADLLSSFFAISALYCFRTHKPIFTAIFIALAGLTRETTLLIWVGMLVISFWQRNKSQIKSLMVAMIPILAWNLYVINLDLPGYSGVKANFGFPLVGIAQKMLSFFQEISLNKLYEGYLFFLILAVFTVIFRLAYQYRLDNRTLGICTLLYAVMFGCSSLAILSYYLDYSRVYLDVYLFLVLSFNYGSFPWKTGVMTASAFASLAFLILHS